jgi:hypothetical protein
LRSRWRIWDDSFREGIHLFSALAEIVAIDLNSVGDKLADLRTFILGWIDQNTQFKRAEEKTHVWQLQMKAGPTNGSQPICMKMDETTRPRH